MKKMIVRVAVEAVLLMIIVGIVISALITAGLAEEAEYNSLYVIGTNLNGREWPTKKAPVAAMYDFGDQLTPTGRMSKNHDWVEVYGGESGTVWVSVKYVTERILPFTVTNENNSKVKIRNAPDGGKLKGYVKHGKSIEIEQVVLGWGRCSKGWVDLDYFIEEVQ